MKNYDVVVVGLGALGGSALFQLASRGASVLGIDRFAPPHAMGSSHGDTRITREAIGEGEHLTPLAQRSNVIWRDMEERTGVPLLSATGLLILSSPEKTSFTHVPNFFDNTLAAARQHRIAHETWNAAEIRRRFPQFVVGECETGYFEPCAGFLRPEACIAAQLDLARREGASVRLDERVVRFVGRAADVLIETEKSVYCAEQLILATGAWLPEMIPPELSSRFRVYRQVQFWFAPRDESFRAGRFPVFIWELGGPDKPIYGFPDIAGQGVKIATEQYDSAITASSLLRDVHPLESTAMYNDYVAPFLRGLTPTCTRASVCLYTVSPDFGFVLDRHPESQRVLIASCCSGHGFKHAPALGEAIAEWVLEGNSRTDLGPFALARFG